MAQRKRTTLLLGLLLMISAQAQPARLKSSQKPHALSASSAPQLRKSDATEFAALAAIEKAVEEKRCRLRVPGAALVIVKDDRIIMLKGFGLRDVERRLPVTPETLFSIASCTKTFTALVTVISADEGKLSLDDSPKKFLPYFQLRDPEADAQVTLRDLLSHRTGVQAGSEAEEIWYPQNSREAAIKIGMQAKPTAKFRERFGYSNVMYLAAGEAIAKAQQTSWEELIASRIFNPLGMTASNFSIEAMQQAADFSNGYSGFRESSANCGRAYGLSKFAGSPKAHNWLRRGIRWCYQKSVR